MFKLSHKLKYIIGFISLLLFIGLTESTDINTPIGEFVGRRGYEGFKLKLKKDGTFEQWSNGCTWDYLAKGKWENQKDTLWLKANRFYDLENGRRKLTDKGKVVGRIFYGFNRLVIVNNDTLLQLYSHQGKIWRGVKLKRKLKK